MRPPNTRPAIAVTSQPPTGTMLPSLFCCTRTRPIVPINKHTPQVSWVSTPASRNKARPGGRGVGAGPGAATTASLLREDPRSGTPPHDEVFRRGRMALLSHGGRNARASHGYSYVRFPRLVARPIADKRGYSEIRPRTSVNAWAAIQAPARETGLVTPRAVTGKLLRGPRAACPRASGSAHSTGGGGGGPLRTRSGTIGAPPERLASWPHAASMSSPRGVRR